MSWIFIDTSERGVVRLADIPARGRIRVAKKKAMPGATVSAIASFFSPTDVERADGICVVAGPGEVLALRGGGLVADLPAPYVAPVYDAEPNITCRTETASTK